MASGRRSVQWSVNSPTTFLVSSASELRLCEYAPAGSNAYAGQHHGRSNASNSKIRTVAVCSDLPAFKSLAWSPDPSIDDLVAVGLNTGRTILLRIHETQVYTSTPSSSSSILQLNIRQPRPCNVVAFSHDEPNLLVTGYDKVRDNSLLVWDIKHSSIASSYDHSRSKPLRTASSNSTSTSAPANQYSNDLRPIAQFGMSEQVSAATFLYSSRMLVASMAQKWIRCYDLRSPNGSSSAMSPTASTSTATSSNAAAAAAIQAKSVTSLVADPFDSHRFASLGEDGLVRMWDLRNHIEPMLTFSSDDGISAAFPSSSPEKGYSTYNDSNSSNKKDKDRNLSRTASKLNLAPASSSASLGSNAGASTSAATGSITSIQFSSQRRGYISTLDKDSHHLSAWNIFEISDKGPDTSDGSLRRHSTRSSSALMLHDADEADQVHAEQTSWPTLYYERRTEALSKAITSFAFVPNQGGPQQFLTINKEGAIGFCEVKESPQVAFAITGQFAYSQETSFSVEGDNLVSSSKAHIRLPASRPGTVRSGSLTPRNTSRERLLSKIGSMAPRHASPERSNRTGRGRGRKSRHPGRDADDSRGRAGNTSEEDTDAATAKLPLLEKDISITMRTRAERGYGLDPIRNRKICREHSSLIELWSWIEHSAVMSEGGRAFVDNFDFGFMGVLPILKGFPPHKSSPSSSSHHDRPSYHQKESSAASKRSRTVSQPSGPTVFEDVRSSIKRSDAVRAQDVAFSKAAASLNKKNGSTPFTSPFQSTGKAAQRQLALSSIGPDFASADISAVIKKYEQTNEPSKAAAWALFSGNIESAVRSLRSNKDERLKLLAPILATHLNQKDQDGHTSFKELCATLSTDLHDPFMRAIFAYLASGDWRDVLEEEGIGLRDRVGVALRFLPDDELYRTLESMAKKAIAGADLEGLLLTGLDASGLALLQSHVDRTGDVQTAALVGAFVSPGVCQDSRAERWIEAYRKLLDNWKLYTIRARFDIARGSKMRSSLAVKGQEENSSAIGALLAPPHMLIRCHFCNETIAPRKSESAGTGSTKTPLASRRGTVSTIMPMSNGRTTRCPHCGKSFPKCAICLESIEVSTTGKEPTAAWCWCQRCRHGGHATHFLEWFARGNHECPVADCKCSCRKA